MLLRRADSVLGCCGSCGLNRLGAVVVPEAALAAEEGGDAPPRAAEELVALTDPRTAALTRPACDAVACVLGTLSSFFGRPKPSFRELSGLCVPLSASYSCMMFQSGYRLRSKAPDRQGQLARCMISIRTYASLPHAHAAATPEATQCTCSPSSQRWWQDVAAFLNCSTCRLSCQEKLLERPYL